MTGMRIGRTQVDCPYSPEEYGDTWAFGFEVGEPGLALDEIRSRVEQLRGLSAGQVVPVVFDDDDRLSGLYRVVEMRLSPVDTYLVNGFVRGAAILTAVAGGGTPEVEVVWSSVFRTNSQGVTTSSTEVSNGTLLGACGVLPGSTFGPAVGAEPNVVGGTQGVFTATLNSQGAALFRPSVDEWYRGAVTVERRWPDGVWRPVVGARVPAGAEVRISNGLVMIEPRSSGALRITPPRADWSGWDVAAAVDVGFPGGTMQFLEVVASDEMGATIEVASHIVSAATGRIQISLLRGQSMATCRFIPGSSWATTYVDTVNPGTFGTDWVALGGDFGQSVYGVGGSVFPWALTSTTIANVSGDGGSRLGPTSGTPGVVPFGVGVTRSSTPVYGIADFFVGASARQVVL